MRPIMTHSSRSRESAIQMAARAAWTLHEITGGGEGQALRSRRYASRLIGNIVVSENAMSAMADEGAPW